MLRAILWKPNILHLVFFKLHDIMYKKAILREVVALITMNSLK